MTCLNVIASSFWFYILFIAHLYYSFFRKNLGPMMSSLNPLPLKPKCLAANVRECRQHYGSPQMYNHLAPHLQLKLTRKLTSNNQQNFHVLILSQSELHGIPRFQHGVNQAKNLHLSSENDILVSKVKNHIPHYPYALIHGKS